MKRFSLLGICISFFLPTIMQAQQVRSSYFMEGINYRMSLNPSFQPKSGFLNIPGIGSTSAEFSTNSAGTYDLFEVFASEDDYYNSDRFYNSLKNMNEANVYANTNILSFGAYKGKGFWTFNIAARVEAECNMPKSMFDYLRAGNSSQWDPNTRFDIRDEKLRANSYIEIGGGYSRAINDRLTVGGKAKFLLGAGNIGININNLSLSKSNTGDGFQIVSDAYLESSVKGVELEETEGYVTDLDYDHFGISGYGAGFDLGANYKLTEKLTLSASLLDLGFIAWSKSGTQIAESDKSTTINSDYSADSDNIIDFELYGLKKKESKSRTTSLSPTLVLGGEYAFFDNELSVGLLSTTRFGKLHNYSELTLSANYRPNNFIHASLSYSMLQGGDTFGFVIRIGQLLVGTDYMYLGKNSKHANAFVGLSIPLGKKQE